jgi:hypothetical protein
MGNENFGGAGVWPAVDCVLPPKENMGGDAVAGVPAAAAPPNAGAAGVPLLLGVPAAAPAPKLKPAVLGDGVGAAPNLKAGVVTEAPATAPAPPKLKPEGAPPPAPEPKFTPPPAFSKGAPASVPRVVPG